MKQLLNTLYIMTQGAYIRLDHETLKIQVEGETKLEVPLHHLGAVVCIGDVLMSPQAMHRCAVDGRTVVLLDRNGHFKARLEGPVSGNVLLRRAQHEYLTDHEKTLSIARNIAAGKIRNSRHVIMRGAREASNAEDEAALRAAAAVLERCLEKLERCKDLHEVRGVEGEAGRSYFSSFERMIKSGRETFALKVRSRRPPRDPVNALLSFLYALLLNDCVSGVEGVGMDPQVGFLHGLRPGRPSLALDIMEEVRSVITDRLALTLINRQQTTKRHFDIRPGGAVYLNEQGRREVITAYQKRKQEEVFHPTADRKVPVGLVPHVQARVLARHLRGDMEYYIPFIYK